MGRLSRKTLVSALVLCALAGGGIYAWVVQAQTVHPGLKNESRFFQTYAPKGIVGSFADVREGSSEAYPSGANEGRGFATHYKDFQFTFYMPADRRNSLAAMLLAYTQRRLAFSGATITADTITSEGGHELRYVAGATEGTVLTAPMRESHEFYYKNPAVGKPQEPETTAEIRVQEKWFKDRDRDGR
ncbi:MAG: hypothetical protein ABI383_11300 [Acidobacteriaceae bacterium]